MYHIVATRARCAQLLAYSATGTAVPPSARAASSEGPWVVPFKFYIFQVWKDRGYRTVLTLVASDPCKDAEAGSLALPTFARLGESQVQRPAAL